MPKATYNFLFCDDVRREIGGKVSFMGVYGPAVRVEGNAPQTISAVVTIETSYGSAFNAPILEIGVRCDDGDEQRHRFENIPSDAASSDRKSDALKQLESVVSGMKFRARLLGVMRAERIKFARYCDIKAYVDDVEYARVVFFRSSMVNVGGDKAVRPARSTRKAVRKG